MRNINHVYKLLLVSMVLTPVLSEARTEKTPVEKRADYQEGRIRQGISKGEVTNSEARQLEGQQTRIHEAHDSARGDGTVTKSEKLRINRMQNRAGHDIHREKNDAEVQVTPTAPVNQVPTTR